MPEQRTKLSLTPRRLELLRNLTKFAGKSLESLQLLPTSQLSAEWKIYRREKIIAGRTGRKHHHRNVHRTRGKRRTRSERLTRATTSKKHK